MSSSCENENICCYNTVGPFIEILRYTPGAVSTSSNATCAHSGIATTQEMQLNYGIQQTEVRQRWTNDHRSTGALKYLAYCYWK